MTEIEFFKKFEKRSQKLITKWEEGKEIILEVSLIKQLCEDYLRDIIFRKEAKELNNSD